jgi:hypothetical protein
MRWALSRREEREEGRSGVVGRERCGDLERGRGWERVDGRGVVDVIVRGEGATLWLLQRQWNGYGAVDWRVSDSAALGVSPGLNACVFSGLACIRLR